MNELTGIGEENTGQPSGFMLKQNYPNPVRGDQRAVIGFSLEKEGYASIKVYDMLGRFVATLFDGNASVGVHSVLFNASSFLPGVYTYVLRSGNMTVSKRMIVAK